MALMAGHQIAIRALHGDFVRAVWRGPTRDESHRGTNSGCDRAGNSHRQLARVLLNDVDDDIASVLPRAEPPVAASVLLVNILWFGHGHPLFRNFLTQNLDDQNPL